ncbi:MAG TPA: IS3 family transposase [Mucilaginibacter sp.]|nr:IS3 family transposase [Mucilaginibacter sp.]
MKKNKRHGASFKLKVVKEYLRGDSVKSLALKWDLSRSLLTRWIDRYNSSGEQGLSPKAHQYHCAEFKWKVVESYLKDGLSLRDCCSSYGIANESIVLSWIRRYELSGLAGLREQRGRPKIMKDNIPPRKSKPLTRLEELEQENLYLRAENELLKKLEALPAEKNAKQKALAIEELRHKYPLEILLDIVKMARSSYYYHCKTRSLLGKHNDAKDRIKEIYHLHKGRYGYRRITLEMKNEGFFINHKTVSKLMASLELKSVIRRKKYRSYRGEIGSIAPNLMGRNFTAEKPCMKWATDITEFKVKDKKLYLSPIIDLFNGEIISYSLSESPNYKQVSAMLDSAFKKIETNTKLILHSDQGWQYQMRNYQNKLKAREITQSMSRKGNCLDNAVIENFFGIIKSELFYLNKYDNIEHLKKDIKEYISYYNKDRIKLNLKGMSPVKYRAHYINNLF